LRGGWSFYQIGAISWLLPLVQAGRMAGLMREKKSCWLIPVVGQLLAEMMPVRLLRGQLETGETADSKSPRIREKIGRKFSLLISNGRDCASSRINRDLVAEQG
jgi:hypothetical protein